MRCGGALPAVNSVPNHRAQATPCFEGVCLTTCLAPGAGEGGVRAGVDDTMSCVWSGLQRQSSIGLCWDYAVNSTKILLSDKNAQLLHHTNCLLPGPATKATSN